MKVYKIFYQDEYEHPNDIEIVKESAIVDYVNMLWKEGRIFDESIEIFLEKHPKKPQTESEAVELLELDGYFVDKVEVYE